MWLISLKSLSCFRSKSLGPCLLFSCRCKNENEWLGDTVKHNPYLVCSHPYFWNLSSRFFICTCVHGTWFQWKYFYWLETLLEGAGAHSRGTTSLFPQPHSVIVIQNCLLWMRKAMRCFRSECDWLSLSCVRLFETPQAAAHQASLSVWF